MAPGLQQGLCRELCRILCFLVSLFPRLAVVPEMQSRSNSLQFWSMLCDLVRCLVGTLDEPGTAYILSFRAQCDCVDHKK